MKSAAFRGIVLSFLALCGSYNAEAFAVEPRPLQQQLEEIQGRLTGVENQQQELLRQKTTILDQIDELRVWVRHNRSHKKP